MNLYEFARKWLFWFQNGGEEDPEDFRRDCRSMGFSMDCGQAFISAFPHTRAFQDAQGLEDVVTQVNDPMLLGSALFSKWRWITHWEYHGDLRSPENCRWFSLALTRLMELTAEGEEGGFGTLQWLRLVSEKCCDGFKLEKGMLYEQELFFFKDGRVRISDRYFEEKEKSQELFLGNASDLMEQAWQTVSRQLPLPQRKDAGRWTAWGADESGAIRRFSGSLGSQPELSDDLRQQLRCRDLLCLDGAASEAPVRSVTLETEEGTFQVNEEGVTGSWKANEETVHFYCRSQETGKALFGNIHQSRLLAGGEENLQGNLGVTVEYDGQEPEKIRVFRQGIPPELGRFLEESQNALSTLGLPAFLREKELIPC